MLSSRITTALAVYYDRYETSMYYDRYLTYGTGVDTETAATTPSAGIRSDANEDGFYDDVHTAANAVWPGDDHDLPLPLPSAANCP